MAEINLGDFPFSGGVKLDDKTIYVGNNRFFRLVSQRDNDSTIGVMYETSDVFDNNATITQLCSEVLFAGIGRVGIKLAVLGDGRIAVLSERYPNQGYYAFTLTYDDVNNTFTTSAETNINNNRLTASADNYMNMISYGQDSTYVLAVDPNSSASLVKISFSATPSATTLYTNSDTTNYDSPYSYASGNSMNIVDDKLYLTFSDDTYGIHYVHDLSTDTFDTNFYIFYSNVCKLSETKYAVVKYSSNNADYEYSIFPSAPTRNDIQGAQYSAFIPTISGINTVYRDAGRCLETFALDDQHLIIFDKAGNNNTNEDNNIYAKVIKIVDEDYAFVSDNSTATNGVLLTSNYNGSYVSMSSFYNGRLINRIDNQRFYIQTDENSFEFFTLTS